MRVAILGGSGFLGTALVDTLLDREYRDIVVVGRNSQFKADLRYESEVVAFYESVKPDIVINLAAFVGGIGLNRDNPGRMFYDNIRIGAFCTHYAYKFEAKKYIYVGTVCGYPKFTPVPFKEEDLWDGFPEETNAPYGVVKKSIGLMVQSYAQQYGLNGMFLIPVNMYGPNDNFDLDSSHVIPALIRKMLEAKEKDEAVTLWGDGSATREFLYVYDCADAIVKAMEKHCGSQPINIGSGTEISIRDLATKIAALVGYEKDIIWDTTKPNGQPRRCLDTSKALKCFGFKSTTSLDDGLRKTVDWYVKQR
jgi:GDP-L-fucose synthase